ncbi:precorrin-3B synthase [Pararhizobium sp. O133]|uniref:precorrin-3B synthase n=1 Tax=Pararhizobium sp. O133 TaxID=3449278 RepID=UPI003F6894E0
MTTCIAPAKSRTDAAHPASMRRGACPSLATPMVTGDGLLVRLRPSGQGFSLRELRDVADAAFTCGNGILEVTARGNLQIRGLTDETVPVLARMIADAEIEISEGLAIETPPLAGFDPTEIADSRPLVSGLRAALSARGSALSLAPKLSVIIDGGGRLHLGGVTADIRVHAIQAKDRILWLLSVVGTVLSGQPVALFDAAAVVPAIMDILDILAAIGPFARAKELDVAVLRGRFSSGDDIRGLPSIAPAPSPAGIHDFDEHGAVLGVGLAFGQIHADNLKVFLEALDSLGATDIRLTPGHGMLVMGIGRDRMEAAQALALGHGLRAFPGDPRNHIAACAGFGACASSRIDTRGVARMLVEAARSLLDGSMTVHVSGCAKGCARPSAAPLTITASPFGYGLVVNGPASAAPNAYIEENNIRAAIERLDKLVREGKRAGESARSCLTRLGADVITAAVQQG